MSYFDVALLYFESPLVSITFYTINFSFCFNVSHIRTSTYNSRNSFILLNDVSSVLSSISTIVEIPLYYLTMTVADYGFISTIVEILLYYLTITWSGQMVQSTIVEILLYYLTSATSCAAGISTIVEILLYFNSISTEK